ncbi:MAG: hypothetical protein H6706_16195 [Myxococcales bacterium]|nr:hypothetical protein [Myxococcales bacterium]
MWTLLTLLACPLGSLPIAADAEGIMRCGDWKALQTYTREGGPAPTIVLPAGGIRALGGDRYVITREAVNDALGQGLGALARQAHLSSAGKGFRLSALPKTSFLRQLGLRDGDVVLSVNGLSLREPLQMLALYAQLATPAPEAQVALRRGGKPRTLTWAVLETPTDTPPR